METLIVILDRIGRISTVVVIIGVILVVISWLRGISPALWRLGNGLAQRKIAIFAKSDNLSSLKSLLTDSKLFIEENIIPITNTNDVDKSEKATLFLVYWPDWKDDIDIIFTKKFDGVALIVYAPQELGIISGDSVKKLNEKRNVVLTNFRGRLLNDIVVSMITTSYEK
ncbi:MAG: hypothetical protein AAB929_01300 [Patescibacteria group bacterium]